MKPLTTRLSDRVAVITGTARGLGVAIAEQFASDGARILLVDRDDASLPEVADKVRAAGAPEVLWTRQDLSQEEGGQAAIDVALREWGKVDILVNNAGGGIIRPFLEHTRDTLVETLNRNLWTTIWCIRAALPSMLERGYGRIVNVSADSVHTGIWSHAGYNAAKGGVNGLTTGLAFEFAKRGITVNCVSPGGIATPELLDMFNPDSAVYQKHQMIDINKALELIPNGRLTELDEVAAVAAFLTYDNTKAINGQIYSVNGGQWML
ncbi:SDR family NAD(P)-dependent oxidoreductase [Paraburkholderia kururiensis]|uniref:SDR family NAD(P)-dependent oxidoreductase n=1 Tax=Paraburkholderia kururiensis TaxID=984307 RepID=UPI00034ABC49|nr:SDR family oxidoreductase [Paraburkholderia kururiensis]